MALSHIRIFWLCDPRTGHLRKRRYGPRIFTATNLLARLKFLRGTAFDAFGQTAERRTERRPIDDYDATVERLVPRLEPGTLSDGTGEAKIGHSLVGQAGLLDVLESLVAGERFHLCATLVSWPARASNSPGSLP